MKKAIKYIFLFSVIVLLSWYFIPSKQLNTEKQIDKIIVLKQKRVLQVWSGNELLKSYKISLGKDPIGHKQFEGDGKTPEGTYIIHDKNPNSSFYLNLGISYPNSQDIKYAELKGRSPGGLIKIHGIRNGFGFIGKFHRLYDWTNGCIAVTNNEIEEIYHNVQIGTVIEIKP